MNESCLKNQISLKTLNVKCEMLNVKRETPNALLLTSNALHLTPMNFLDYAHVYKS